MAQRYSDRLLYVLNKEARVKNLKVVNKARKFTPGRDRLQMRCIAQFNGTRIEVVLAAALSVRQSSVQRTFRRRTDLP